MNDEMAMMHMTRMMAFAFAVLLASVGRGEGKTPPPYSDAAAIRVSAGRVASLAPSIRREFAKVNECIAASKWEAAIASIEKVRAIPGSPVADLDDMLARVCGLCNIKNAEVNAERYRKQLSDKEKIHTAVAKRVLGYVDIYLAERFFVRMRIKDAKAAKRGSYECEGKNWTFLKENGVIIHEEELKAVSKWFPKKIWLLVAEY